jgi:hypothetical protein
MVEVIYICKLNDDAMGPIEVGDAVAGPTPSAQVPLLDRKAYKERAVDMYNEMT